MSKGWDLWHFFVEISDKIPFLDALASLDLKLSLSEWVSQWCFSDFHSKRIYGSFRLFYHFHSHLYPRGKKIHIFLFTWSKACWSVTCALPLTWQWQSPTSPPHHFRHLAERAFLPVCHLKVSLIRIIQFSLLQVHVTSFFFLQR